MSEGGHTGVPGMESGTQVCTRLYVRAEGHWANSLPFYKMFV